MAYLVVVLDHKLNYKHHIVQMKKKRNSQNTFNQKTLFRLYLAYVEPLLQYGVLLYELTIEIEFTHSFYLIASYALFLT